jgi:tRNA threonylcarbamoyladenosine modification (KEOPS) complex  Pcc1 subunit
MTVNGEKKALAALEKALIAEKAGTTNARMASSVSLNKEGTKLMIRVESTDATALRAGLNTYLRILQSAENIVNKGEC